MSLPIKKRKSKRGVSIIIGYVLLITFAVIIGVIVYRWMKTYVPQEDPSCPSESSIFIESVNYDCTSSTLTMKIINNGNFDMGGYFIYGSTDPNMQMATIDLTQANTYVNSRFPGGAIGVKFGSFYYGDQNDLKPGESEVEIYDLSEIGRIYSVEIIPFRWQTKNRKISLISCDTAKIEETLGCFTPCIDEPEEETCDGLECGLKTNNCGDQVDCGDCVAYGEDYVCNILGQCVEQVSCTETCDDVQCGWACGVDCNKDCPVLDHAESLCDVGGVCALGVCDAGWGDCDTNPTNGCETPLGTTTNCAACGDNCGAELCISGICATSGGETTCDGVWNTGEENVDCDGTPLPANCLSDCSCTSGYASTGTGGCTSTGGGITCTSYCVSLGVGYTSGPCVTSVGICQGGLGGDRESGGDSECVGASSGTLCCCTPGT
jgi:hypothetical protein